MIPVPPAPFHVPWQATAVAIQSAPVQQRVTQIDDTLTVEWTEADYDAESQTWTFRGVVKATYGPTVIVCPSLVLNTGAKTGVASGGVEVTDPDGFIRSDRLEFDWLNKSGLATDCDVQVGNVKIKAERLEIGPGKWTVWNASATLSREESPTYEILCDTATLYPGKYGIAEKVSVQFGRTKIGRIPEVRFSLDRRVGGFGLPSISNKKGVGVGVSWGSSFLINDQTGIGAFANSYPGEFPASGLMLATTGQEPSRTRGLILPRSDLGERFRDGYFDNISVRSPKEESSRLRSPRLVYFAGTSWNQGTTARLTSPSDVSKALDLGFESGGEVSGVGLQVSGRFQRIRSSSTTPFTNRLTGQVSLQPRALALGSLDLILRADAFVTASDRGEYGWLRGQVGVSTEVAHGLRLGAGYVAGRDFGAPDFDFDPLYSERAWHFRADYVSGPYTARYLAKYDLDRALWYDAEFELALVAGGFEPFVMFRKFPNETRIGLRFRIDTLVSRLQQRKQRR